MRPTIPLGAIGKRDNTPRWNIGDEAQQCHMLVRLSGLLIDTNVFALLSDSLASPSAFSLFSIQQM
jgi:hypothetical protein